MLPLVELKTITKSNNPPWVYFTFFKFYKLRQIAQSISYRDLHRFLDDPFIIIDNSEFENLKLEI